MKAFQVLYVLCFTRPRYQVRVYRTTGPLVYLIAFMFIFISCTNLVLRGILFSPGLLFCKHFKVFKLRSKLFYTVRNKKQNAVQPV